MSNKKIKIMIVEDEALIAMDLKGRLINLGYNVTGIASSFDTAVALANKTMPDFILMDVLIKGYKDGIETARVIKKELSIPSVFLTAQIDEITVHRMEESQPLGLMSKPFNDYTLQDIMLGFSNKIGSDGDFKWN